LNSINIFIESNEERKHDLHDDKMNIDYSKERIPSTFLTEHNFGFKTLGPNPYFPTTFEILSFEGDQ
jgi:hypothetical protein